MEVIKSKNTQKSAKKASKQNSNYELLKKEDVENTPFTIITMDGKSFGAMGTHRITAYGKKEEIREELKEMTWNRIVQVIMILTETLKVNELTK